VTDCELLEKLVPKITASDLEVTPRGRVTLATSDTDPGEQCDEFLAPEYRTGQQVACEASLEKVGSSMFRKFCSRSLLCNDIVKVIRIFDHVGVVHLYFFIKHKV
jgi:hypothetical protein